VAAPRKYPESLREAMFALYGQGIGPTEIARRCEEGLPGFGPLRIPRRTVADIVASIALERGKADLPQRIDEVLDGPGEELAARYPKVVLGLINADAERLRRKVTHEKLTLEDYNRLRAAAALYKQITASKTSGRSRSDRAGRGRGRQEESVLDRLARLAPDPEDLEQRRQRERDGRADGQTGAEGPLHAHARESENGEGRAEAVS